MLVTNCRMCQSANMVKFLDLGSTPPADQFLFAHQIGNEQTFPLEVLSCRDCGLAQLSYVVPKELLFCQDYPYEASTTTTACRHWAEFAEQVVRRRQLRVADLVVDVGSNVGVLLEAFRDQGQRVVGVDPAENMAQRARHRGIPTFIDFFGEQVAKRIYLQCGQAAVITATNTFAHVHDLHDFMRGIQGLLRGDGVLVIESPHFMALVKDLLYDTIYHEHLSYLSVKPLTAFFAKYGMEIFDIERQANHGESFRYFVRFVRGDYDLYPRVESIIAEEDAAGIYNLKTLTNFAGKVARHRHKLRTLIKDAANKGKRVAAVSAPAKGMTLLNYCGLDRNLIDFATEKTPLKIGRVTPGTHIPIVEDRELLERKPDYALLLAWNFAPEIMQNLSGFGGKFIIPMPSPQVVQAKAAA